MASSKKGLQTEYVAKKDGSDNPVEVCKGWFDNCEYCDKRFGEWIPVDEDIYEKIPEKPGFFMIALQNKNITEVVSTIYNQENIQKTAIPEIDKIKDQVSNKKMKATKSAVLVRWMVLKKVGEKDSVLLCCHWNNTGVLPKYQTSWPGQSLMEGSDAVFFATQIQKWCYKQKDPVWRKEKPPPPTKNIVQKCNFQKCDICDSYFTPWQPLSEVMEKDLAPNENGLVMLSAVHAKKREILDFCTMGGGIVAPIKSTVINYDKSEGRYLNPKFGNKNATLQVRWTIIKNVDSDNACFLFAHFHNAEEWPTFQHSLYRRFNGEPALDRNKNFIFNNDKKWYHETEALKPAKLNKAKNNRRELFDQLYAEDNYEMEQ